MTRDEVYLGGAVVREFPYRAKWTMLVLGICLFGATAAVFWIKAANNTRGVIVNGLIELGPLGATVFYWVLTAVGLLFTAIFLLLVGVRLASVCPLVVTDDGVYVPRRPLLRRYDFAAFPRITALSEQTIQRPRYLYIYYDGGKCSVMASMLPAKGDLDALIDLIRQRSWPK